MSPRLTEMRDKKMSKAKPCRLQCKYSERFLHSLSMGWNNVLK